MDTAYLARRVIEALEDAKYDHTCLSCEHFNQQTEGCAKANGARPPAKVIVDGCPAWYPHIPF